MKLRVAIITSLLINSFHFSQGISIQTKSNAATPVTVGGFFQTNNPINYPPKAAYNTWWYLMDIRHDNPENNYAMQFSGSFEGQDLYFRKLTGDKNVFRPWNKILMETSEGKVGIGTDSPVSSLNLKVPSSSETISAMSIDVESFNNNENLYRSTYFQVRDLGSTGPIPFIIKGSGNVGIGVNNPQNRLDVNGIIHAKEVKIDLNGWADFVFKPDFDLPTLEEVEKHIQEKGHLPNVPSEQEVLEKGVNLGDNQKLLLQKIEELTLYSIEQNKQIKTQSDKIQQLELENSQIKSLLKRVEKLEKNKN